MLGDRTRLRLLALLEREELTVAEMAGITRLAQPRVSTHLARLREAGLVVDRREGVSVYYRIAAGEGGEPTLRRVWSLFRDHLDDGLLAMDAHRLQIVLKRRTDGRNWPDSVAGDMERHYSPGRTWEATARALVRLIRPGRVLDVASGDGVMGELLTGQAESIDCLDVSDKVVAAGRERVEELGNVRFHQGDMHALPFADNRFDTVLLLHALTYSEQPEAAVREAMRVLAPGGRLLCATLRRHRHGKQVEPFGHVNSGFREQQLEEWCIAAGLNVEYCAVTSVEKRPPHFQVITLLASKDRAGGDHA